MPSPYSAFLTIIICIFIKLTCFGHNNITIYIGGHFYAEVARSSWTPFIRN